MSLTPEQKNIINQIIKTIPPNKDYFKRTVNSTLGADLKNTITSVNNNDAVYGALAQVLPWSKIDQLLNNEPQSQDDLESQSQTQTQTQTELEPASLEYESQSESKSEPESESESEPEAHTPAVREDRIHAQVNTDFVIPAVLPESNAKLSKHYVIYTFKAIETDEIFVVNSRLNGFIRHAFNSKQYHPVDVLKISLAVDTGIDPYDLGFNDSTNIPDNIEVLESYIVDNCVHHPYIIYLESKIDILIKKAKYVSSVWVKDELIFGRYRLYDASNAFVNKAVQLGLEPTVQ